MKHLVVYCHPNTASFNRAVRDVLVETLKEAGHDVRERDLYSSGFDPVLKTSDLVALKSGSVPPDVKREQEYINWADVVDLVFPVWWTGLPAMVKGYIDRVFSHGFAYRIDAEGLKPLLTGKKAVIINTTGSSRAQYEESGMYKSLTQTMDEGIFAFCGMEVLAHKFLAGVPFVSDADRKDMLEECRDLARKVAGSTA